MPAIQKNSESSVGLVAARRHQVGRTSPFVLLACLVTSVLLLLSTIPASGQEYADNVVIVLDASGSMAQRMKGGRTVKMEAAKSAIKAVLQTVPPSTQVGLLVFSASNVKNDWIYPLGPRDDSVLIQALDRVKPGSKTPLGAYIKKGADRLLTERAKQYGYGSYRLLIVTDGEASDRHLVERYTPEAMARGITMDVIGVSMNQAHTLATKVHSYRRADDPESLSRAIREVFAEVGGQATDVAQANAFDVLAPIPIEVASTMIQALSVSGNDPLGTKPKVSRSRPAQETSSRAVPQSPAPKRSASTTTHQSRSRGGSVKVGFATGILIILGVVGVLFIGAIVVIVFIVKAARRRSR